MSRQTPSTQLRDGAGALQILSEDRVKILSCKHEKFQVSSEGITSYALGERVRGIGKKSESDSLWEQTIGRYQNKGLKSRQNSFQNCVYLEIYGEN